MKILVTGGAGFIGSHVVDAYIMQGHSVTVVDDLSTGKKENVNSDARFIEKDIRDKNLLDIFREGKFDILNHHAAQMDVRKSVEDPVFDASVNIVGTLNLLECCRAYNVGKVIFASTGGAIYGEQEYFPADELHPMSPLSPYGVSKLAVEKYLHYFSSIHGLAHVVLRYANVYGPRQNPHGEAGVVAIFVNKMLIAEQPVINGDGTQTRDYVYVEDVVRANSLTLQYRMTDVFNVGTGIETDVNTLFHCIREITGSKCATYHGPAKKGEQQRSVLGSTKAQKLLGWNPSVKLLEGLQKTVDYFQSRRAR